MFCIFLKQISDLQHDLPLVQALTLIAARRFRSVFYRVSDEQVDLFFDNFHAQNTLELRQLLH